MRIKSQIWVQAYIRTCATQNVPAIVVHHGDDDAGAIFIRINRLNGTSVLLVPAPAGLEGLELERRFAFVTSTLGEPDETIDSRIRTEREFDPDIWVVEVEDSAGEHHLSDWNAPMDTT